MAMLAPLPARVPPPPTEHHAAPSLGHSARAAGALTAAAAAAVVSRRPETVRSQVLLRAAGSDFAIIRFRIPGVDDLTMLPRVVTAFCVALFIYNKVSAYGDPDSFRQVSETLAVVLSLLTWSIPWVTGRLEEAVRRQVDAKPSSRKPGSIQTLAIKQELPSELQLDISWLSSSLLRLTNADGLAIWHEGSTICSRGIVKRLKGFAAGSEFVLQGLDAAWTPDAAPVDGYCATRRGLGAFPENLLPGKVLPDDTESAIVKPLPGGGHLVLWSARPRAFDKEADRLWVANAAAKLGGLLHGPKSTVPDTVLEECFEDTLPLLAAEEDAEASRDPFARFDLQIRVAPTIVGVLGLGVLIFNRQALVFSEASRMGVDPAQTRADLCAGVLAITLVLQGLVWVSETPKSPDVEDTTEWDDARNVLWVDPQLAEGACQELVWSWGAFSKATRACSMALFWRDKCVMQGGLFQPGMDPVQRDFCKEVISMGKGRYLAQLNNYPAKEEFLDFLPKKTQGLLLTPLRPARNAPAAGLLVLGLNAMRGFGKVDQAWAAALAEKLAVTLDSSD